MDADRSIEIGIGRTHYRCCRTACRQPRDVDVNRVDGEIPHDLSGDSCDQRWLASVPQLVAGAKPVPAFRGIGRGRLAGISDEQAPLFCYFVHLCSGGQSPAMLATMQHHDSGSGFPAIAAWNVELVHSAACRICEGTYFEARAVRQRFTPVPRATTDHSTQVGAGAGSKALDEAAHRLRYVRLRETFGQDGAAGVP